MDEKLWILTKGQPMANGMECDELITAFKYKPTIKDLQGLVGSEEAARYLIQDGVTSKYTLVQTHYHRQAPEQHPFIPEQEPITNQALLDYLYAIMPVTIPVGQNATEYDITHEKHRCMSDALTLVLHYLEQNSRGKTVEDAIEAGRGTIACLAKHLNVEQLKGPVTRKLVAGLIAKYHTL